MLHWSACALAIVDSNLPGGGGGNVVGEVQVIQYLGWIDIVLSGEGVFQLQSQDLMWSSS